MFLKFKHLYATMHSSFLSKGLHMTVHVDVEGRKMNLKQFIATTAEVHCLLLIFKHKFLKI